MANDVPCYIYGALFAFCCLGTIFIVLFLRGKVYRIIAMLLFVAYSELIYCSTVIFRTARKVPKFDLTPFWSYERDSLILENIMNTVIFIPTGLLLAIFLNKPRWWKVLFVSVVISASIEILQFVFKKGFAELDDVFHNTLGCLIGYGLYCLLRYGYEKFFKGRVAIL